MSAVLAPTAAAEIPADRMAAAGLRAYFMPEDDTSTLYVYEVAVK